MCKHEQWRIPHLHTIYCRYTVNIASIHSGVSEAKVRSDYWTVLDKKV